MQINFQTKPTPRFRKEFIREADVVKEFKAHYRDKHR
jgi:hypothetical protein